MFRTEINPKISEKKISLSNALMTMGSCFSDHMGMRLIQNKFDALSNPFGVIFNPISINKLLGIASKNSTIDPDGWIESQDIHQHYDLHSQLGSTSRSHANENITAAIKATHDQLHKSNWLIITWGTAIVYKRKDKDHIVANCHKVPTDQFNKKLLRSDQLIADFETMLTDMPKDINIILTVSPVRHLKETLELNSVSKSTLRVACHDLASRHESVHYFPSYELILDDLRDYRFYKPDMLHPSDEAIDYVWNKFSKSYYDKQALDFIGKWQKIRAAIDHRPFNAQSKVHQQFIKATIQSMTELNDVVDVTTEIQQLAQQLIKE